MSTDIFSRMCNLSTISEGQIITSCNFHVPKGTTRAISPWVMLQEALFPTSCPAWVSASLGPQVDFRPDSPPFLAWWLLGGGKVLPLFQPTLNGGLRISEPCPASSAVLTAPRPSSPLVSPTSAVPGTQRGQPAMGHSKFLKCHFLFWFLLPSLTMEINSSWLILSSIPLALSHPDFDTVHAAQIRFSSYIQLRI